MFDMRVCDLETVRTLCERHHGYGSAGGAATYAFAVYEDDIVVAAYAWQPPPPGAAKNICPEAPYGVLALSRMVAVPKAERRLEHVSKPLRRQMLRMIDRGRWPVLVTYSDEGQGHTGHVYKCSGWQKTTRAQNAFYVDSEGRRASSYAGGKSGGRRLKHGGWTWLQRWEHWICEHGAAANWISSHGWKRRIIPGKVWRSGRQAFRYVQVGHE